jgi:hypothetical protein
MRTIKEFQNEIEVFLEREGGAYGYYSPIMLASLLKALNNFSDIFTNFYNFKKTTKLERDKIEKELGSLMFNMVCLANNYGIDLERVLDNVVSNL